MHIESLSDINKVEWEDFVKQEEGTNFFFTTEWKSTIEAAFSLKPLYYMAKDNNGIFAILPLFIVKSLIFGNRLISLPFSDHGGVYFTKVASLEQKKMALGLFLAEISRASYKLSLDYIEFRGQEYPGTIIPNTKFICLSPYVTFIMDLKNPFNRIYRKFSRSIKRNINFRRNEIRIERCTKKEELSVFYKLYLSEQKSFGSPPLSKVYFEKEWSILKDKNMLEIFIAYHKKRIVGALSCFVYKKTIHGEFLISDPHFDNLYPKAKMLYETIRWGLDNGMHAYDFGRTRRGTGVYYHKKKWGGAEGDINYSFMIFNQKSDIVLDYKQNKFLFSQYVIKILPLFVLKFIGHPIRRNIGK